MAGWREVAAKALAAGGEAAPVRDLYGLDVELYRNLSRLASLSPPAKIENAENWRRVVRDAQRLAREGWTATALSLGWTVADLYGVGARDDWDFQGLAIWVQGRKIVALDDRVCLAGDERPLDVFEKGGPRHGRMPVVTPVMLWDFGR
ncbi:hypothetical protein [Sphingomonas sp. 10B4]|uniref:hypothetical protein n=1 Tax=Sphingomonas sp. 10B4 TaxID=3048575 RepID=UPI002AB5A983|nr:hypothetical protein [Sphingomonas sp. 10B4]MDY7525854.1 hypothetical protein [Sphingomonas sp. 10B4]MEB0284545.1 hypothetical protein [Sphingomonas sp. 10B4]